MTAKQCICAALVKGCQHIKRDSGNACGDPGLSVHPQNRGHVTGRDSGCSWRRCRRRHAERSKWIPSKTGAWLVASEIYTCGGERLLRWSGCADFPGYGGGCRLGHGRRREGAKAGETPTARLAMCCRRDRGAQLAERSAETHNRETRGGRLTATVSNHNSTLARYWARCSP